MNIIAAVGIFFATCTLIVVGIIVFEKPSYEPVDPPDQEEIALGEFIAWAEHSAKLREFS